MTIQRQYNLPNCILTLEGMGNDSTDLTARPLMSLLVNMECRFVGQEQMLSGGPDFFASFVTAVSQYAQEFLSGVRRGTTPRDSDAVVQLQPAEGQRHALIVQSQVAGARTGASETLKLDLTTVQLFDLVEAVDQFFADSQTLPGLTLQLTPISRREGATQEPVVKRTLPAAIGVSGLAITAAAFFMMPVPEVEVPRPPSGSETEEVAGTTGSSGSSPSAPPREAAPADPPEPDVARPSSEVGADDESEGAGESELGDDGELEEASSASDRDVAADAELDDPELADPDLGSSTGGEISAAELEALVTDAPEITDADQLLDLNDEISDRISQDWTDEIEFDEPLIYRVAVDANGQIVGYRSVDGPTSQFEDSIPLPELLYIPTASPQARLEPLAEYRIVFQPTGALEVSPWKGF